MTDPNCKGGKEILCLFNLTRKRRRFRGQPGKTTRWKTWLGHKPGACVDGEEWQMALPGAECKWELGERIKEIAWPNLPVKEH